MKLETLWCTMCGASSHPSPHPLPYDLDDLAKSTKRHQVSFTASQPSYLHTAHCTLHIVHRTLYATLRTVRYTRYMLHIVQSKLRSHSSIHNCKLQSVHTYSAHNQ